MRQVSKKKAVANRAYKRSQEIVLERSGGVCEVRLPGCLGRARNTHHVLPRSAGGTDDPENLLALCGSGTTGCHGWLHAHPEEARKMGILRSRYAT